MAMRESDAVVVPEITGNTGVGKDGTQVDPGQGTHKVMFILCILRLSHEKNGSQVGRRS